jgi:transposase-like protein
MPWEQSLPMDQKTQFVSEYLHDTISFTELCDRYGISRKTGYKWIDRYLAEGPAGLKDRSQRPHSSRTQMAVHRDDDDAFARQRRIVVGQRIARSGSEATTVEEDHDGTFLA